MRTRFLTALAVAAGVITLIACGNGGPKRKTGTVNRLSVRASWQQPSAHAIGKQAAASVQAASGGFGPVLPRAVKSVSIRFESDAGDVTCVAVDAATAPIDPVSGQRLLVLHELPAGPGTVTIFGFATDVATALAVCEGRLLGTPSFRSDPHPVTIVPGTRTDAGDIDVYAVPFLVDFSPSQGDSIASPVPIEFTVADAEAGIDQVDVLITTSGASEHNITPDFLMPCDDATARPCSDGGDLGVTGFRVQPPPQALDPGPVQLRITATNRAVPPRSLDFSYGFTALPGPTPTPTMPPSGGVISGTVVDCLTGAPLPATVELLEPQSRQTETGADGRFGFNDVPFGSFRVQASAAGFVTSEVAGTLSAEDPEQDLTIALCPPIALRVVLTWGSGPPAPADLDGYLRGPAPGASAAGAPVEFQLFFRNRSINFPTGAHATLDIDSRNFRGPETESVGELAPGVFRYCVHDFTDRDQPQASGLANSSARVAVFLNDQQVGDFAAPNSPGTVWEVFDLDTTHEPPVVVPVNASSDESNPDLVCRRPDDRDGDGLSDAQEAALGTDPDLYDTNANGLSDGQDVINGTDPLPPHGQ